MTWLMALNPQHLSLPCPTPTFSQAVLTLVAITGTSHDDHVHLSTILVVLIQVTLESSAVYVYVNDRRSGNKSVVHFLWPA
jgi:hypothetical protein